MSAARKKIMQTGKLPNGIIDLRAMRYSVKQFLISWWHVAYREFHGKEPPPIYIIGKEGHSHYITPEEILEFEEQEYKSFKKFTKERK